MRTPVVVAVCVVLATGAAADTVYLANGNKFENVVAEARDGELRIVLPYGEIVLADNLVDRVERSPSIWREYARRETELRAGSFTAGAWLELARWADRVDYAAGLRRALLRAAELEPALAGLEPLMGRIGYLLDPESGRWVSEKEYMERRGYLLWGDRWLPREAYLARLREREEGEKRRRDEARQERIARAIEALAVLELERAARPEPAPAEPRGPLVAVFTGGGFPVAAFPGVLQGTQTVASAAAQKAAFEELADRQPGSLLPLRTRRRSD